MPELARRLVPIAVVVLLAACRSGSGSAPSTSTSVPASRDATIETVDPPVDRPQPEDDPSRPRVVTVEDVRYDCGPDDAPVVSFRVSSPTSMFVRADLVVLAATFGTAEFGIGPEPFDASIDIGLTQAAYDAGRGEVRITSDDGEVVARQPVTLRLDPGGGCG